MPIVRPDDVIRISHAVGVNRQRGAGREGVVLSAAVGRFHVERFAADGLGIENCKVSRR